MLDRIRRLCTRGCGSDLGLNSVSTLATETGMQDFLPSFRKQGPISKTLSNPPKTSRLSQSSGAILNDIWRSGNSVAKV